jgi:hypothetical protein
MHCQEFEQRLNAMLDQRSSPSADARLAGHAARCEACRRLLAGHEALLVGVSRLAPPAIRRDFAHRVVAAAALPPVPAALPQRPRRRWLAAGTALASAAAMLIAASLVWYAQHNGPAGSAPGEAARQSFVASGRRAGGFAMTHVPSNRAAPSRKKPAMTGGDWLIQAPRLPDHFRNSFDELAVALPGAVERLDEVEQIAPGIRPLRLSLSMIWDTLCRTIPGAREVESKPRQRTSLVRIEPAQLA